MKATNLGFLPMWGRSYCSMIENESPTNLFERIMNNLISQLLESLVTPLGFWVHLLVIVMDLKKQALESKLFCKNISIMLAFCSIV
jgi:uncharacterized membrane protein